MATKKNPHNDPFFSPKDSQVGQHVEGIATTLDLSDEPRDGTRRPYNARYGTILGSLALELARSVDHCPKAFPKGTVAGDTLREEVLGLSELTSARGRVSSLLDQIDASIRARTERLVFHVDRTMAAITTTLGNPFTDAEVRRQLQGATAKPLRMVAERRHAIANAAKTTKAKNTKTAAAEAVAAARTEESERLAHENRFLRGEEVSMDSITVQPAPTAPKTARRSGRTTRKTPR